MWELDDSMVSTGRKFAPEGPIDMQLPVTPGSGSLDHCFQVSSGSTPFPSWPDGPTMAISIFTKSLDKGHTIDRGELCLPYPSPPPPGEKEANLYTTGNGAVSPVSSCHARRRSSIEPIRSL